MRKILIFIILAFGIIGGCGAPDDCNGIGFCTPELTTCSDLSDFKIVDITNGANSGVANSFWNCKNNLNEEYNLSIFEDKTGETTAMGINGPFLWHQSGCLSIRIKDLDNFGLGQIHNIRGSSEDGMMTHSISLESFIGGGTTEATCDLVVLVQ